MNIIISAGVAGVLGCRSYSIFKNQSRDKNKQIGFLRLKHTVKADGWDKDWDFMDSDQCKTSSKNAFRGILYLCPRITMQSKNEQEFNNGLLNVIKKESLINEFLKCDATITEVVTSTSPEAKRFAGNLLKYIKDTFPSCKCVEIKQKEALNHHQIGYEQPIPTTKKVCMPDKSYRDRSTLEAFFRENISRPDQTVTCNTLEVYIGHPDTFKYILTRGLQYSVNAWNRFQPVEGSYGYLKIYSDGRVIAQAIGSLSHLPNTSDDIFLP